MERERGGEGITYKNQLLDFRTNTFQNITFLYLLFGQQEKVKYSGDLSTELVWHLNGQKEFGCQMVHF